MDKPNGSQFATASSSSFANPTDSALLRGVDHAGSSLHDTIDKMAAPTKGTVDKVASAAHSTVDKLAGGASTVASKLAEHSHLLTDVPLQAVDYSKAYIKDHPLQAVGGALVIGWLLGRLTATRY